MPRSTHGAVANRPSIVQKANATAIRAPAKGYNDGGKK
jgi:hypothetical protein